MRVAGKAAKAVRAKLGKRPTKAELVEIGRDVASIEASLLESKEVVLSLKAELLKANEENLKAKKENLELREKIQAAESKVRGAKSGALDRTQWERKKVRRAWVVVRKGEDEPHYCITCFDGGKLSALQRAAAHTHFGTHKCNRCKGLITI